MTAGSASRIVNTRLGARIEPSGPRVRATLELLGALVDRELKGRYKGSALGFLWAVLVPLFMAAIYVVFLRMLVGRALTPDRVVVGVFAWQFTAQSVQAGMASVTGNANLVKKVFFPRWLLPAASTLAQLINYLLSLLVQFAVLGVLAARGAAAGVSVDPLLLPAAVALLTMLNFGMALLLAAAHVHFRDTQHLVGVLLSAWFFVSPVMYDLDLLRPWLAGRPWLEAAVWLNPLTPLLTGLRAASLDGVAWLPPPWAAAGLAVAPATLALGAAVFRRAQRHFADLL